MNKCYKIEIRNVCIELAALKNVIKNIRANSQEMTIQEDISTADALKNIEQAIKNLGGAI